MSSPVIAAPTTATIHLTGGIPGVNPRFFDPASAVIRLVGGVSPVLRLPGSPVTLPYVGPNPISPTDSTLSSKGYADAQEAAAILTTAQVTTIAANAVNSMGWSAVVPSQYATTTAYLNAVVSGRSSQSAVTTALGPYVLQTKLNAASGVAALNASAQLPSAQVPSGTKTDRVSNAFSMGYASGSQGVLGGQLNSVTNAVGAIQITTNTAVTSTTSRTLLATCACTDPGYPWIPIPMGFVTGYATSSAGGYEGGSGSYGLVTVTPPTSTVPVGIAICTGDGNRRTPFAIVPYAAPNQTPASVPPLNGAQQLNLYGQLWSGTSYTFVPDNLSFWIWQAPAL